MAAVKCSGPQTTAPVAGLAAGGQLSLGAALSRLDAWTSTSVEPADYSWGQPTLQQQQQLYQQFMQLAFFCTLPAASMAGLGYPGAYPAQAQRPMFPLFVPPFPGFMPPGPASCSSPTPSPCPPAAQPTGSQAQQQANTSSAPRSDAASNKATSKAPARKATAVSSKAKVSKAVPRAAASNSTLPMAPACAAPNLDDLDIDDDLCKLLEDKNFLENLQDDVSEGSNGSACSDARALSKNNSNGSLCASGANNDGAAQAFASAFDAHMDEEPAAAAVAEGSAWSAGPGKATSGDLNNLVAPANTPRSTRNARSAAKDTAAASKLTIKLKGGVQKASGAKPSKAQQQALAGAAADATAGVQSGAAVPEDPLSAADLSRLLGEDDNRIPDGWDLDLDFENPFSCSITAF